MSGSVLDSYKIELIETLKNVTFSVAHIKAAQHKQAERETVCHSSVLHNQLVLLSKYSLCQCLGMKLFSCHSRDEFEVRFKRYGLLFEAAIEFEHGVSDCKLCGCGLNALLRPRVTHHHHLVQLEFLLLLIRRQPLLSRLDLNLQILPPLQQRIPFL